MYQFDNSTIASNYDKSINDDYREFTFKLKINGSIYGYKGGSSVQFEDGEIIRTYEMNENNYTTIGSIKFEHDLGMEDWTIGQTPYGKLVVTLKTASVRDLDYQGAMLEPIILLATPSHINPNELEWVEVPYGVYYVDNVEINPTYTTLTAYDKMYKLQKDEYVSDTYYPTTVGYVLDSMFTEGEDTSDFDPYRNYELRRPIEYKDKESTEGGGEDEEGGDELFPDDNDNLDDSYPGEGEEIPDNENGCCDCPDDCCGGGGGENPGGDPGGGEEPGGEDPGGNEDPKGLVDKYWNGNPLYESDVRGWDITTNGGGIYSGCKPIAGAVMKGRMDVIESGGYDNDFMTHLWYKDGNNASYHAVGQTDGLNEFVMVCEPLATQYVEVKVTGISSNLQGYVELAKLVNHYTVNIDPSVYQTGKVSVGTKFYLPNYFVPDESGAAYSCPHLAMTLGYIGFTFEISEDANVSYNTRDAYIDFDITMYGYQGTVVTEDLRNYSKENVFMDNVKNLYTPAGATENIYFRDIPGCPNEGMYDDEFQTASITSMSLDDYVVSNMSLDGKEQDNSAKKVGEGMTKAELLGYIAGICGGNCYFDHNGNPRLLKLKKDTTTNELSYKKIITVDQVSEPAQLEVGRSQPSSIYCTICEDEALDLKAELSNFGNYVISIFNPFMTADYLSAIATEMRDIKYYPLSVRIQGDPRLWVGDCLYMPQYPIDPDPNQVIIVEEGVYPIMSLVGSFDMGFGYEIESNCKSDSQREDNYQGTLTERVSSVESATKRINTNVSAVKDKMEKIEALVGYINQLFAIEVSANSVVSGTINTEKVRIKSGSGNEGLVIDGDSIDFVDRSNTQRIHIGSDNNQGEYIIKMTNSQGYTRTFLPKTGDDPIATNMSISSYSYDPKDDIIADLVKRVEELEKRINEE